jgi:hypothetical protein
VPSRNKSHGEQGESYESPKQIDHAANFVPEARSQNHAAGPVDSKNASNHVFYKDKIGLNRVGGIISPSESRNHIYNSKIASFHSSRSLGTGHHNPNKA